MKQMSLWAVDALDDRKPEYGIVGDFDLDVVRFDESVSVFYGGSVSIVER